MANVNDIKKETLTQRLKRGFDKFADKLAADKPQENMEAEAKNAEINVKAARADTAAQIKAVRGDIGIDR